jgi:restriction system protein
MRSDSLSSDSVSIGRINEHYNANGSRVIKYSVEVYHNGLHERKLLSATDTTLLKSKITIQNELWSAKWAKFDSASEADQITKDALDEIERHRNILTYDFPTSDKFNFGDYFESPQFYKSKPIKQNYKPDLSYPDEPIKPILTFSFFEKLFTNAVEKKTRENDQIYNQRLSYWKKEVEKIKELNEKNRIFNSTIESVWEEQIKEWQKSKDDYKQAVEEQNSKIEQIIQEYKLNNVDKVLEYFQVVLENINLPESIPNDYEMDYNADTGIIIIEFQLPEIDDLPKLKEVKYISSRNELKESYISDAQLNKLYDDTLYQVSLRIIHEFFIADQANILKAVSFNGWVNTINKATGFFENSCIISIIAKKEEFMKIDLKNVDPKICFKTLKGVASSKLSSLTAIQPILQISRDDKRFVNSYDVTNQVDNETNLAAMDWEDFEHLIREIFEKEFMSNGGEVKVTQASRDGGVDAIAFDPDPIRGGKIVIQAKRYTNTVGVSAVRDLYGTTLNEGATKGILVSTADYGPDAYEFAKGKPLTLLNGSNLLHLLEKHGHHAKIDLKEAKKIIAERANA